MRTEQFSELIQITASTGAATGGLRAVLSSFALRAAGVFVGRRLVDTLAEMQRAQWFSADELQARAEARLARLLRHVAEHVPFYREHCRAHGIEPQGLRSLADLARLPVVNKAFYRAHTAAAFEAENLPAFRRLDKTTSGSTGEPFRFSVDRAALPVTFASHLFYDSWCGLRPFDRYVRIMAPPAEAALLSTETPAAFRLKQMLTARLQQTYEAHTQRKLWLWEVSAERAAEIWRELAAFRPRFVLGYTSTLAALCDEWLRRGFEFAPPPVRGVITIAETLTPARRKLIEAYFQAPIINRYGLREFGSWSAQSCAAAPEQFHVNTELVICEVLRADGTACAPGATGRVVLTDLWNEARPFIRYETGDLAVAAGGHCACGRGFPLLGALEGRSVETLRTPAGRELNPVTLGHYLFVYHRHQDAVRQYQLLQEASDRVRLLVVPDASWDETRRAQMQTQLAQLLGAEMQVSVEAVTQIAPEPSGKRPIIKLQRGA